MIILDTETTGLVPGVAEIISLGAVRLDNQLNPKDEFYAEYRIEKNPEYAEIKPALDVSGFTMEQIHDESKPTFKEAFSQFEEWCLYAEAQVDKKLVRIAGQNIHFDVNMIKAHIGEWPFDFRLIDSYGAMWVYRQLNRSAPKKFGLDAWIRYFKLDKRGKHNALEDAMLTAEVFRNIIIGLRETEPTLF